MKYLPFSQTKSGSNGWVGQAQHLFSWRRISQSEIRNSAAAEKSESESEGGQKFLPPNPLPFCPPERSVSVVPPTAGAINRSFVQKRFELRSVIATNQDISNFQGKEFARSPRLRRVSLRKKPCPPALFQLRRVNISELNQRSDKFKFSFSGKQTAVRNCEAIHPANAGYPIFSVFCQRQKYKASFF